MNLDLETQPPPKKYMLHRGLATVDLFTAAAELTDDELALMDQGEISIVKLDRVIKV